MHDLAQYSEARGRYYIDQNRQIVHIRTLVLNSGIKTCDTSILGTLNVENHQLLKLEGNFLVKYSEIFGDIK